MTRPVASRITRLAALIVAMSSPAVVPAAAAPGTESQNAPAVQRWSVTGGTVRVRCPLTVGGSFNAETSSVAGTLSQIASSAASYDGTLAVDLATLDTGIDLRNAHMRDTYLEIARGEGFARAVLSNIRLGAAAPPDAERHRTAFSADLLLHGVTQRVDGDVELRLRGGRIDARATFPVSLEAFEIQPPRYLGLGVRDRIEVTVAFEAVPTASQ